MCVCLRARLDMGECFPLCVFGCEVECVYMDGWMVKGVTWGVFGEVGLEKRGCGC